jgi:carbon monoxide dehydrogenase subunit G
VKLENSFTIDAPVEKAWQALNTPETVAPCFPGATLTTYEGDSFSGTVKVKLGPVSMTYKGKGTYVTRDEAAHEVVIEASGRDSRGNGTANATVTAALAAEGPDRTAVSMVTDMTITGKPAQFGRGVIADVADRIIGQFSACVARKLAPDAAEEAAGPASAGSAAASNGSTSDGSVSSAPATSVTPAAAAVSAPAPTTTPVTPAAAPAAAVSAPAPTATPAAPAATAVTPAAPAVTHAPAVTPAAPVRSPVRSEVDAIDLLDTAGAPVLKRLAPAVGGAVLLLLVILLVGRVLGRRGSQNQ